ELAPQFVLPLLRQVAGGNDRATLQVTTNEKLLDEQPGHDGLARTGVVREQEAKWLARQHRLIDGEDLVRQRLHQRCVDGDERVEQVRQSDAMRLGDKTKEL